MTTHLVLDLDETIISTSFSCKEGCNHVELGDFNLHVRPYFKTLLDFCKKRQLSIIIYSAADKDYVHLMVNSLFLKSDLYPTHILDGSHMIRANYYGFTKTKTLQKVREVTGVGEGCLFAIDDCLDNFVTDDRVFYIKGWSSNDETDVELLNVIQHLENNNDDE
jgi:hypothetical protein